MTPSNANTSELVVAGWRFKFAASPCWSYREDAPKADWIEQCRNIDPLVTAESAEAEIERLVAENDVLNVEVLGLRAAIFGGHDYDPSLHHANFIEMARATEDARKGAIARATAAEARADRLVSDIQAALKAVEYQPGDHPIVPIKHDSFVKAIKAALRQEG